MALVRAETGEIGGLGVAVDIGEWAEVWHCPGVLAVTVPVHSAGGTLIRAQWVMFWSQSGEARGIVLCSGLRDVLNMTLRGQLLQVLLLVKEWQWPSWHPHGLALAHHAWCAARGHRCL